MDTPYHLAPQDYPLTQMTEEYMEQAGRGLRPQTVSHGVLMGAEDMAGAAALSQRDSGAQTAFTSTGVTLRGNSANRSGRRARRVSAGVSEDALATDSGVFEAWGKRPEEYDELSYAKEASPASEPTQVQLGLLWESASQSLLLHVLQLKNLNCSNVRESCKVYVKVHLTPLDTSRACAFYCCKTLEPQSLMAFNEGFRIPVLANALPVSALQVSVCSLGPHTQEELLGTAKLSLADCEGSVDMVYHWLRVQMLADSQKTLYSRRTHDSQEDEARPRATDSAGYLLPRSSTSTRPEEQGAEMLRLEKDVRGEAASERGQQAASVDSGCSTSAAVLTLYSESLCTEVVCLSTGGPSDQTPSRHFAAKVEKATMTESPFPEPVWVRPKERGGRWGHGSPFMRGGTLVRSQTFSPGVRSGSHYVCRLYRSDSDSSTLPKKLPFVRNTVERRTLRYKQPSYRSSLAEQPTRTSLDLELDLQACRTRLRQLMEELSALRELKLRLEEPQASDVSELPNWALRDERFHCLLREVQRQANQSQQEQRHEEAVERRLRKASKEVLQMRGQNQKEPLPVQTFREKIAFFTRPRFNIPPLPADDV